MKIYRKTDGRNIWIEPETAAEKCYLQEFANSQSDICFEKGIGAGGFWTMGNYKKFDLLGIPVNIIIPQENKS